ncbi:MULTISPECIES: hypothetical protein [unclassified Rhizobium]|uniref:hypothetical protein n=1 Tax=unclassified Rhizobium TaxID=2613769 RepID=UPI0013C4B49A|nr:MULTISPECIES: hypothetical protein [unclassified Rhizobium]
MHHRLEQFGFSRKLRTAPSLCLLQESRCTFLELLYIRLKIAYRRIEQRPGGKLDPAIEPVGGPAMKWRQPRGPSKR